jgi:hypothetical protein
MRQKAEILHLYLQIRIAGGYWDGLILTRYIPLALASKRVDEKELCVTRERGHTLFIDCRLPIGESTLTATYMTNDW